MPAIPRPTESPTNSLLMPAFLGALDDSTEVAHGILDSVSCCLLAHVSIFHSPEPTVRLLVEGERQSLQKEVPVCIRKIMKERKGKEPTLQLVVRGDPLAASAPAIHRWATQELGSAIRKIY